MDEQEFDKIAEDLDEKPQEKMPIVVVYCEDGRSLNIRMPIEDVIAAINKAHIQGKRWCWFGSSNGIHKAAVDVHKVVAVATSGTYTVDRLSG